MIRSFARAWLLGALVVSVGCGSISRAAEEPTRPSPPTTTTTPTATTATTTTTTPTATTATTAAMPAPATTTTATTAAMPAPATTTTATRAPATTSIACPDRGRLDATTEEPPGSLTDAIESALAAPAWAGMDTSVSIWVEGYGEVAARAPDLALLPASNQKLYTAIGAILLLDGDRRFVTEVREVDSDLVLVAGGDPTLTTSGPHSLDELARRVRQAGVTGVERVILDVSRYESATTAAGWQDWHIPRWVGPMSALVVDDNRYRSDPAYVADPSPANGERFVERLRRHGVQVSGAVVVATAPPGGRTVASVRSAPGRELVGAMLRGSDNETAESLLREIGGGATASGIAAIDSALSDWCLDLTGTSGDGSGLSRANRRSAREWRRLLQVAADQPWAAALTGALPVAGRTGTLAGRLTSPGVAGNVSAKTGSIIGGRALSGYATTASGRRVVFAIITNGDPERAAATRPAIDAVVEAVVLNG